MPEDCIRLKNRLSTELCSYNNEKNVPTILIKLLISAEDHRFFSHCGVDIVAILRAIWRRAIQGKWEGASTIEMQLVRVLTQNYEFSFRRKIRESLLASLVNKVVPKKVIPCIYLANAYYGWKMNGIDQVYRKLNISLMRLLLSKVPALLHVSNIPSLKPFRSERNKK